MFGLQGSFVLTLLAGAVVGQDGKYDAANNGRDKDFVLKLTSYSDHGDWHEFHVER